MTHLEKEFRTTNPALPFKVLADFKSCKNKMVRPAGIEPATTSLEGWGSIQLSYGREQAGWQEWGNQLRRTSI
jgi:hypothetical protein